MAVDIQGDDYFHNLAQNLPCAIFRASGDDAWALAYLSERIHDITGHTPETLLDGRLDYARLIYPDDYPAVHAQRRHALHNGQSYSIEYRIVDANGVMRWLWESGQPVASGVDGMRHLDGIIIDISERKEVETALRESDEHFRAFLKSTESIVLYLTPNGDIAEFNPAAEALYGKSRAQVLGKSYFELFLPEEAREPVRSDMRKVLAGTPTRGFENDVVTATGERRMLTWYVTRILDAEGRPSGIVASGHDITDRKLAEQGLLASQKMLRLVLDSIPVRVYWKDRNLNYLGCNSLFAQDVGLNHPDEVVGKNDDALGWSEWRKLHEDIDCQVIETGIPTLHCEAPFRLRGEGEMWVSISKVPLTDVTNNVIGILSSYEDITNRRKAEQQAAERNLRLQRLTELSLTLSGDPDEVFQNAARMLGELLDVRVVCVAELKDDEIHFVSMYADGKVLAHAGSYALECTPCFDVVQAGDITFFHDVAERFPAAQFLKDYDTRFYCGFPALGRDGRVTAVTSLLDSKVHKFSEEDLGLLRIFGQRIAVEIERRRYMDEQSRAEEQMRKLSSAVEQTADLVMITDRKGCIEYVNPAFEVVTGYLLHEVIGKSGNVVKSSRHDNKFYKRLWGTILRGDVFQDVIINRKKGGELYYEEKTITPLKDAHGEITHFISTGKDITERMRTQERLYHLAYHDILTQLPNRGLFVDRLNHALARQRDPKKLLAVLFMDLDRFKIINDTLGHDTGDHLLKLLSQRIVACLREGDTVARLAGDEFVILLEDISTSDDVAPICRKILDGLAQPFQIENKELFVTGSIGIALSPVDGSDAATLIRNADIAMYRAKELGRNTYQFYSADMSTKAFERLNLETSLRHALKRNELVLYYQPQVSPTSGRIIGAEALLRWCHQDRGMLLPDQFITLLEDTGLIIPVGEWVLQTAINQARQWCDAGFSSIRVSVNLSSRQFDNVSLKQIVTDLMREIGLGSEWIGLEITETVLMTHDAKTVQTLQELSAAGVQISIDDFGTGYSSLSYLKRLPIDALKIDGSFIRDVTTDADDAAIVQAIIAMAKSLKLDLIAEGVETPEQLDFVRGYCASIQGYFYSTPLPANELTELLRRDNASGVDWTRSRTD